MMKMIIAVIRPEKVYDVIDIIMQNTVSGDHGNRGDEQKTVEAVLVDEGIIKKTGTLQEVLKNTPEDVEKIDLEGKTLMPAFIDGHSHFSLVGQMSFAADLRECVTFEEIIDLLKDYKDKNHISSDGIIFGFGYDHNFLPGEKHPTKEYLNQVSQEIPVYILHASAHMGCGNDKAMEIAGINSLTPNIEGGVIGRVDGSNEPNGYLEENGMKKMNEIIGSRMKFDLMEAIELAQNQYFRNGITTAQDGASSKETVEMLKMVAQNHGLKIDVVSYPMVDGGVEEIFKNNKEYVNQYVNHFKLGGYKAVLDGSPQGKSAWLTKPKMLHSVWCAVNRITRNNRLLGPEERCSVYEGLKAITINAAYAYFEEDRKGSIVEGKRADLVILDKSPLEVPVEEIKDIEVLSTIKDGEVVYSNQN